MFYSIILPLMSFGACQQHYLKNPPYPSYDNESLGVRQLQAMDFVAIVEPTGDGILADRHFVSKYTRATDKGPVFPWPENRYTELFWAQPFRVVDSYGTAVVKTVTGLAMLHDPSYVRYGLEAGPMPRLGGASANPSRFLLVGTLQHQGELRLSHLYRYDGASYAFDTDIIEDGRSTDEAMVYRLIPTNCSRLTVGSDLATTVLRTLADSIRLGGEEPVKIAAVALGALTDKVGVSDDEQIEGAPPFEWRDRVIGASLAATVRSGKLAPAERLRVASLLFERWGVGDLHDDYLRAIVARDKTGVPMPQELYDWCAWDYTGILKPGEIVKTHGMEPLYADLVDARSKLLFVRDRYGQPKLDSTYRLLLRDMNSHDDLLVVTILRTLYDWSGQKAGWEPERGWQPGKPRPEQWNKLIDHWSQPGAFKALETGKG